MSFTSSFAHLDGVEFKLSELLQVAPVDGLPSNFKIKDPTALLLASEYDFTKEREALASIEAKRKSEKRMREQQEERKQLSLKRRADRDAETKELLEKQQREILQRQRELFLEQRRRQQQEKAENESTSSGSGSPDQAAASRVSPMSEDSADEFPPPLPPKNVFLQVGNIDILKPQPAAQKVQENNILFPVSTATSPTQAVQSEPVSSGSSKIWVDFEDKDLDPFSNMELETIDDMKELQTVLQNATRGLDQKSSADNLQIPSYSEATSSEQTYENTRTSVLPSLNNVTSMEDDARKFKDTNPFYADVAEISTKLKTIIMNSDQPSSLQNQTSHENMKVESPQGGGQDGETETSSGKRNESPAFDITPNDERGTLYQNVTVTEIGEKNFKFKDEDDENKEIQILHPDIQEPVYDFAKDPAAAQRLSPLSTMYGNLGKEEEAADKEPPALYSSIVRPRRRAPKPTEQKYPPKTGSNWTKTSADPDVAMPIGVSMIKPEFMPPSGLTRLDHTGSTSPTNPVLSGPSRTKVDSSVKVLPVSFGAVNNSLSTNALPPITSNNITENAYMNVTHGSVSDPGLSQKPVPPPRRPPVPPRDPVSRVQPNTQNLNSTIPNPMQTYPFVSQGSSQIGALTLNGAALPGHTHQYPPYSLPVTQAPVNSPSTSMKSSSSAGISNPNTPDARPPLRPRVVSPTSAPKPSDTDITFIKKSQQDRARFEETMNRALSSLPKNPVVIHKPTSPPAHETTTNSSQQPFSSYTPLPSTPRSPSPKSKLLQALPIQDREFVNSIASMGFDVEATIRATKSYGRNVKEVVDHLCTVQRISEQGFSVKNVQDALEIYNEDKQITKYLHQASQLIDMGFGEDDVKRALVRNNNDQVKALDQLMGQT